MDASNSIPESAPVDGQDHDRVEGTTTDTPGTMDDQGGNRPDRDHSASGVDIVGQAHDRIDAEMDNNGTLPDRDAAEALTNGSSHFQDNGMSEESMDTTPDNPLMGMPVLPDGADPSAHLLGIPPKLDLFSSLR